MIRTILSTVFGLLVLSGTAQTTITGVVKDATTNETLPGVTIYTNSSRTGTASDMDGKFSLILKAQDDSLTFSFIGYKAQTVAVGNRTTIDIALAPDIKLLDEFVIIGYGTQRKSDLTGAITTVGAEEITKVPASNPMQAMQGKVAGLQVGAATGAPGSSPVVRLRGVGTFNDASVLYVVDGVFTNDINFLSSNDIESMTVLKDASATALYGSRGANGVIVVTTKRGKMTDDGKPRFQFDAEYSLQKLDKKIDLLTGREFAQVLNVINPGTFNNIDRVPNTDWQDLIFRDYAPMQSYNFSLSGASEKNQYYLGIGYFKQEGIIPKSDFERVTIKLNNQYSLTDKIRSGVSIIATPTRSHGAPNVIANAYRAWPTEVPFNDDGSFADVQGGGNPLATIEYTNNETNALLSLGNLFVEFDLLKGLTAKSSVGYEVEYASATSFTPVYRVGPLQENVSSDLNKSSFQRFNWLWENTVAYQKEIKKHRFDALAGITAQRNTSESIGASTQFLIDEDPNLWYIEAGDNEFLTASNGAETTSIASYLFRLNYTFDNRFLFTGNFRRDGSSKFGINNRYGNFGSVAVGWNLMNESFMAGLQKKIQTLKIRGSYGTVGNEKIRWDRQYTLVQNGQNVILGPDETIVTGASYGVTGNPSLQWETTSQINIGFEFGVLNNRLTGEMDYYNKTTSDILLDLQNPGHMGNGAFQYTTYNAAEVRNSGFEFMLNWKDDINNGIYYEVGVLGATVKNEVLKMGQLAGSGSSIAAGGLGNGQLVTLTQVGGPIGAFYGYQVIGVFQDEAEVASSPTLPNQGVGDLRFADTNGDGILDERDMTQIGSNIPDFIYGFNFNVGYKGFSVGLDFNGQVGNEIYNGKDAVRPNQYNYEANVADHWTGPGTSNTEPRPTSSGVNYLQSDRFVQNGSFFRLRTATIGYELPESLIQKVKLRRASVYLRGTNLFTLTKYTGYTPEILSSNVLSSGIDLGVYPVTTIYSIGINLSF
jgi:TonB-linked SusC/RagA family outer membrane protein